VHAFLQTASFKAQLTVRSKVLMKKPKNTQSAEKLLEFSGTPSLITICTRETQKCPNYIFTFCFFEIDFNIMLPITLHYTK